MDGQQFDRLTRAFASGTSRRTLLKLFGGSMVATAAGATVFRADQVAAQGGPGDPCAPGSLVCAEGLLCAAEQEGVCYCEDPSEPWLGCACTTGTPNPCGDTTLLCCADTEGTGVPGTCTSASVGCEPRGECSELQTSCEASGCCAEGTDCGANGWCNACYSGSPDPCGGINEAFGADYICCTYGDKTPGAIGWCTAADECVVEPPNTGTGTAADDHLIAPAVAIGAAAAVLAWKSRTQPEDGEA
jgi:hypothetical protein